MKILLISPLPPPVGGIASWTINILEHYKKIEDITLIHQNTAIKSRTITDANFSSRLYAGIKDSFKAIASFHSMLKKRQPDVIHMTSSGSLGLWRDLLICVLAKFHKIPIVMHFRFGRIPEICKLNNWEWKLLKRVISFCSAVIVLDNETYNTLKAVGFENTYNIPNPISSNVESLLNTTAIDNSDKSRSKGKIIFVGHIVKNKGVLELAEACSQLSNIDELLFIGPYEYDIKANILSLMANSSTEVVFAGVLDKVDLLVQMRNATMLALPSYSEGFPNVIIEAMAMKCPVVATNVGAIASMLEANSDKPCGVVIEPRDIQSLVAAINTMITDSTKRELFSENAFLKVKEQYTLEKVCSQYEQVWNVAYQQGKPTNV